MSEFNITINQSKERMITSYTYMVTWGDLCTTLTNNDRPGSHQLTIVAFHAQHLRVAISTVTRATHTFFMRHCLFLRLAFSILGLSSAASARRFLLSRSTCFFSGC